VLSIAAISVLLLPVTAFVLLGHADPAGWIPRPSVKRVEFLIYSLLGGDNISGARVYEYPALAVATIAFVASVRRTQGWRYALVVSGALLPIVLVLAVSLIKPFFVDKYLVEGLPFAVLLLAVGLAYLRPRVLSLGVTIYLLAFSTHALLAYYRTSDKDDWRAATRYILASAKPGDGVVLFPHYESAPFDYYRASIDTTGGTAPAVAQLADVIPALQQHFRRVWSVYNPNGVADPDSPDSLSHRFPVLSDSQFPGIRVTLYDTRRTLPDTTRR
jgi:hypothetical protein